MAFDGHQLLLQGSIVRCVVAESFNPYREWLNLDDHHPNHYALLGLDEFEDDGRRIASAADLRFAQVRRIRPGQRAVHWQQLLDEIAAVKACLTDASRKAKYDTSLRMQIGARQPVAGHLETETASSTTSESEWAWPPGMGPSARSTGSDAPVAKPVSGSPKQLAAEFLGVPAKAVEQKLELHAPSSAATMAEKPLARGAPRSKPPASAKPAGFAVPDSLAPAANVESELPPAAAAKVNSSEVPDFSEETGSSFNRTIAVLGGVTAAILLVLVVALFVQGRNVDESGSSEIALEQSSEAISPDSRAPLANQEVVSGDNVAALAVDEGSRPDEEPPPATLPPATDVDPVEEAQPVQESVPGENVAKVDMEPDEDGSDSVKTEPATRPVVEPAPDLESAAMTKEPPVVEQQARGSADTTRFREALAELQSALADRNLEQAEKDLKRARTLAASPEEKDTVAGWESLHSHVTQFWGSVRAGLIQLAALDELKIGSTIFIVVESSPEKLTIRLLGRNRSYKVIEELPIGIARLLAEKIQDPNSADYKVQLGSFLAIDAKGDRDEARDLLGEAARGGADSQGLLSLLDSLKAE